MKVLLVNGSPNGHGCTYTALKEILGEVHREDLLDALFSNFCLGK